ncbi:MAG: HsdR family type I site-specific deoxyribonuclease [Verrucomicrobia bacterium]|nr:HsdR family type I site-specific deoxyribonuclease [Verrucomicrobiota bacterium]
MTNLALEAATVQFPLVRHAVDAGWAFVSEVEALDRRGGEGGLFFHDELRAALLRLNPGVVTTENVASVIAEIEAAPPTIEGNKQLLEWLRGQRTTFVAEEKRSRNVRLIDFGAPLDATRNVFQVTVEWAFRQQWKKGNRPDVVFLINGVPVALVECKNPKLKGAMEKALVQLRRYEKETPEMLVAPQVFNLTHLIEYFYGVTWGGYGNKTVFNWKQDLAAGLGGGVRYVIPPPVTYATGDEPLEDLPLAAEPAASAPPTYGEHVKSFFDRPRFLTLLREWILFFTKDDDLKKTVLRQHQTRAIEKVVARCRDPRKTRGLVWHTQGSGKTFTMITAARLLLTGPNADTAPTVLLVVDRNELEGQLAGWVDRLLGEISQAGIAVEKAYRRTRLRELLEADFRGLIITMIHKFDGMPPRITAREDFFVLIDEAHRTTGGDLGNYLMGALPAATFIGFTGTPIAKTEKGEGTFKTFGLQDADGYLDKYPIAESIRDRTTLKLRHSLAPSELTLDESLLESEFLALAETEGVSDIDDLNRALDRAVNLKAFLKADHRVAKVAAFVATHFRENVEPLGYKAFLVAVDREACAKYKQALDRLLPPECSAVVYSQSPNDVVERPLVAELQLENVAEKAVRKTFPKPGTQPQILIVTDKLLTGYDAPILYCMYLDKPMRDHVLLQAVARVNRPYEDARGVEKPCGLIIDFVGILKDLKKALAFDSEDYTGVIEGLDVLLVRFRELMDGPAKRYLPKPGGPDRDAQLEKLLYQTLFRKEAREVFAELFKEIETLYEILSPDPALADDIAPYNRLADLYAMMQAAYGRTTSFVGELANKTAMLVQKNAVAHGLDRLTKTVEFDEAALAALRVRKGPDEEKVINLIRSLDPDENETTEPHLISIAERAAGVMEALDERQASTQQALEQLETLMGERLEAERARQASGLAAGAFGVFWELKREGYDETMARSLAVEIEDAYRRFPNASSNADELRQLKAEIYKVLLKVVGGAKMIALAEKVMRARPASSS